MLMRQCTNSFLESECYIFAPSVNALALVVDPGGGSIAEIKTVLAQESLQVGAVLLTHGHMDHIWGAAEIADSAPVYIPGPDFYRLEDPVATTFGPDWKSSPVMPMIEKLGQWQRPETCLKLPEYVYSSGTELVPGVIVRAVPAPGHTEGSTVFLIAGDVDDMDDSVPKGPIALTGDVVFAGSVGRTDLFGGDQRLMMQSLRTLINVINPDTVLLPGHGPYTIMQEETTSNPYLRQARVQG